MKRPNILFLMTDQQRWDGLGCANPMVKTPHLDQLAARGIRFPQAICNAPMCVPSRYSMMTGLYPSQSGLRHNTQMCPTDGHLPVPVLPQRLHDLGYQTARFGKTHWYIGSHIAPDMRVQTSSRGFETGAEARPSDPLVMEPGAINMQLENPDAYARLRAETAPYGGGGESELGYTGCTSALPSFEHREGWLTEQTLEFLDNGRDPERPLFLYLSFDFPHAGLNVPAGYEELYNIDDIPDRPLPPWDAEPLGHARSREALVAAWKKKSPLERRRTTLRYYALCSYVDDLFGRVLRRLDKMGELENTFILFTSDHGEMLGDRFHRFSKYSLYEGSVRVPLFISGAGVPAELKGSTDDRYAELIDVLPTLLQVAGAPIPQQLPGRSLLEAPVRTGSFAEMHGSGYEPLQQAPAYMWRTQDWKLILYLPGELAGATARTGLAQGELYDLRADPHEWNNLYDDAAVLDVRERLTRDLLMYLACVWARYPYRPARAKLADAEG
jgi:arylsulfatase A-like enzyme